MTGTDSRPPMRSGRCDAKVQGNLFVVSRLGQVRNVQTFIRDFGATENNLAVLHTDANPVLSANIDTNVRKDLFDDIVFVRQPERPLAQGPKKNRVIYKQIEDLLVRMADKGVKHLYLCNVDNYYSFFERVIRDRRLPMSLGLLEEGLGTYHIAGKREYVKESQPGWPDVKQSALNFARAGYSVLRTFAILVGSFLSWVFRTDVFRVWGDVTTRLFVEERLRYGRITHFDTAHVYFPEKIHTDAVAIDRIEKLDFYLEPTAPPEALAAIPDDSIVFVSQKYVQPLQYFQIVFKILDEMGLRTVYFKFHPREDLSKLMTAWDAALANYPDLHLLYPDAIQSIPVEELMMAGKAKQVIGLTSTSLMYADAFFPGVDVVSIGSRFRQLAESGEFTVAKRDLAEFNRDLEVFLEVSGVRQF